MPLDMKLLRGQICQFQLSPNFPLSTFIKWVECSGIDPVELVYALDELKSQLEIEAEALRRYGQPGSQHLLQQQYWCFYCEQVRSYYRTVLKHPELERHLIVQSPVH